MDIARSGETWEGGWFVMVCIQTVYAWIKESTHVVCTNLWIERYTSALPPAGTYYLAQAADPIWLRVLVKRCSRIGVHKRVSKGIDELVG